MHAREQRASSLHAERDDRREPPESSAQLPQSAALAPDPVRGGVDNLSKTETPKARPCGVIAPERTRRPPSPTLGLHQTHRESWPMSDHPIYKYTAVPNTSEYVYPQRNISPRQTFQENMRRILVPPRSDLSKIISEPAAPMMSYQFQQNQPITKNVKNPTSEPKYCEVPYVASQIPKQQRTSIVRNSEVYAPNMGAPPAPGRAWPTPAPCGPAVYYSSDYYSHPQGCAPPAVRPNKAPLKKSVEEMQQGYGENLYRGGDIRFEPYPSSKEKYPRTRYEYVNFPNSYQTYVPTSQKYDSTKPAAAPAYINYTPQKYVDPRIADPHPETYVRPTQYLPGYTASHPGDYMSAKFNPPPTTYHLQSKLYGYPLDTHGVRHTTSAAKVPYDASRMYYEHDFQRGKPLHVNENTYMSEIPSYGLRGQFPINNYPLSATQSRGTNYLYHHRNDNAVLRNYSEHLSQYKYPDMRPGAHNPLARIPAQFSPNVISPSESNTSNESVPTLGTPHEDCGYVSQCSTTSSKSVDCSHYKQHRYENNVNDNRAYHLMPANTMQRTVHKSSSAIKDTKNIDVRQFLQMWAEDDDDDCVKAKGNTSAPALNPIENVTVEAPAALSASQQPLYVLGYVNIPSEEIGKYEHIQKVCKLPENIRGYDSADLLNKFDEAFRPSASSNFAENAMNHSKQAPKENIGLNILDTARPPSPFDIEAKITQSVIHKEVGCNFEIKPFSPLPQNADTSSVIENQNERKIEKIINQNIVQPTISSTPQHIENTVKSAVKRRFLTNDDQLDSKVMKTVNSQCILNNNGNKYDVSGKEYNTVSGVCLASLPRLDNEMELNFPEINEQYSDMKQNKESVIISTPNNSSLMPLEDQGNVLEKDLLGLKTIQESDASIRIDNNQISRDDSRFYDYTQAIPVTSNDVGDDKNPLKLSKFRRNRSQPSTDNYSESLVSPIQITNSPQQNSPIQRTDSVIIKNPESIENTLPALDDCLKLPPNRTTKQMLSTIDSMKHSKSKSTWTTNQANEVKSSDNQRVSKEFIPKDQSESHMNDIFPLSDSKSPINLIMHSHTEEYTHCIRPSSIHSIDNEYSINNKKEKVINIDNPCDVIREKSQITDKFPKSDFNEMSINVAINLSIHSNQSDLYSANNNSECYQLKETAKNETFSPDLKDADIKGLSHITCMPSDFEEMHSPDETIVSPRTSIISNVSSKMFIEKDNSIDHGQSETIISSNRDNKTGIKDHLRTKDSDSDIVEEMQNHSNEEIVSNNNPPALLDSVIEMKNKYSSDNYNESFNTISKNDINKCSLLLGTMKSENSTVNFRTELQSRTEFAMSGNSTSETVNASTSSFNEIEVDADDQLEENIENIALHIIATGNLFHNTKCDDYSNNDKSLTTKVQNENILQSFHINALCDKNKNPIDFNGDPLENASPDLEIATEIEIGQGIKTRKSSKLGDKRTEIGDADSLNENIVKEITIANETKKLYEKNDEGKIIPRKLENILIETPSCLNVTYATSGKNIEILREYNGSDYEQITVLEDRELNKLKSPGVKTYNDCNDIDCDTSTPEITQSIDIANACTLQSHQETEASLEVIPQNSKETENLMTDSVQELGTLSPLTDIIHVSDEKFPEDVVNETIINDLMTEPECSYDTSNPFNNQITVSSSEILKKNMVLDKKVPVFDDTNLSPSILYGTQNSGNNNEVFYLTQKQGEEMFEENDVNFQRTMEDHDENTLVGDEKGLLGINITTKTTLIDDEKVLLGGMNDSSENNVNCEQWQKINSDLKFSAKNLTIHESADESQQVNVEPHLSYDIKGLLPMQEIQEGQRNSREKELHSEEYVKITRKDDEILGESNVKSDKLLKAVPIMEEKAGIYKENSIHEITHDNEYHGITKIYNESRPVYVTDNIEVKSTGTINIKTHQKHNNGVSDPLINTGKNYKHSSEQNSDKNFDDKIYKNLINTSAELSTDIHIIHGEGTIDSPDKKLDFGSSQTNNSKINFQTSNTINLSITITDDPMLEMQTQNNIQSDIVQDINTKENSCSSNECQSDLKIQQKISLDDISNVIDLNYINCKNDDTQDKLDHTQNALQHDIRVNDLGIASTHLNTVTEYEKVEFECCRDKSFMPKLLKVVDNLHTLTKHDSNVTQILYPNDNSSENELIDNFNKMFEVEAHFEHNKIQENFTEMCTNKQCEDISNINEYSRQHYIDLQEHKTFPEQIKMSDDLNNTNNEKVRISEPTIAEDVTITDKIEITHCPDNSKVDNARGIAEDVTVTDKIEITYFEHNEREIAEDVTVTDKIESPCYPDNINEDNEQEMAGDVTITDKFEIPYCLDSKDEENEQDIADNVTITDTMDIPCCPDSNSEGNERDIAEDVTVTVDLEIPYYPDNNNEDNGQKVELDVTVTDKIESSCNPDNINKGNEQEMAEDVTITNKFEIPHCLDSKNEENEQDIADDVTITDKMDIPYCPDNGNEDNEREIAEYVTVTDDLEIPYYPNNNNEDNGQKIALNVTVTDKKEIPCFPYNNNEDNEQEMAGDVTITDTIEIPYCLDSKNEENERDIAGDFTITNKMEIPCCPVDKSEGNEREIAEDVTNKQEIPLFPDNNNKDNQPEIPEAVTISDKTEIPYCHDKSIDDIERELAENVSVTDNKIEIPCCPDNNNEDDERGIAEVVTVTDKIESPYYSDNSNEDNEQEMTEDVTVTHKLEIPYCLYNNNAENERDIAEHVTISDKTEISHCYDTNNEDNAREIAQDVTVTDKIEIPYCPNNSLDKNNEDNSREVQIDIELGVDLVNRGDMSREHTVNIQSVEKSIAKIIVVKDTLNNESDKCSLNGKFTINLKENEINNCSSPKTLPGINKICVENNRRCGDSKEDSLEPQHSGGDNTVTDIIQKNCECQTPSIDGKSSQTLDSDRKQETVSNSDIFSVNKYKKGIIIDTCFSNNEQNSEKSIVSSDADNFISTQMSLIRKKNRDTRWDKKFRHERKQSGGQFKKSNPIKKSNILTEHDIFSENTLSNTNNNPLTTPIDSQTNVEHINNSKKEGTHALGKDLDNSELSSHLSFIFENLSRKRRLSDKSLKATFNVQNPNKNQCSSGKAYQPISTENYHVKSVAQFAVPLIKKPDNIGVGTMNKVAKLFLDDNESETVKKRRASLFTDDVKRNIDSDTYVSKWSNIDNDKMEQNLICFEEKTVSEDSNVNNKNYREVAILQRSVSEDNTCTGRNEKHSSNLIDKKSPLSKSVTDIFEEDIENVSCQQMHDHKNNVNISSADNIFQDASSNKLLLYDDLWTETEVSIDMNKQKHLFSKQVEVKSHEDTLKNFNSKLLLMPLPNFEEPSSKHNIQSESSNVDMTNTELSCDKFLVSRDTHNSSLEKEPESIKLDIDALSHNVQEPLNVTAIDFNAVEVDKKSTTVVTDKICLLQNEIIDDSENMKVDENSDETSVTSVLHSPTTNRNKCFDQHYMINLNNTTSSNNKQDDPYIERRINENVSPYRLPNYVVSHPYLVAVCNNKIKKSKKETSELLQVKTCVTSLEHIVCMEPDSTQECHGNVTAGSRSTLDDNDLNINKTRNEEPEEASDNCENYSENLQSDFIDNANDGIVENEGKMKLEECDSSQTNDCIKNVICEIPHSQIDSTFVDNDISYNVNDSTDKECVLIDSGCILTESDAIELSVSNDEYDLNIDQFSDDGSFETNTMSRVMNSPVPTDATCESDTPVFEICENSTNIDYEQMWIDDVACVETVVSEEVEVESDMECAEAQSLQHAPDLPQPDMGKIETNSSYDLSFVSTKMKNIYGDNMDTNDIHLLETLYRTPHMDVRNKLNDSEYDLRKSRQSITSDSCDENNGQNTSEYAQGEGNADEKSQPSNLHAHSYLVDELPPMGTPNPDVPVSLHVQEPWGSKYANFGRTEKLITKAAQKYLPPLPHPVDDLTVKLPLPEERLVKLKSLKVNQNKHERSPIPKLKISTSNLIKNVKIGSNNKKSKPKFEDVLKHIEDAQYRQNLKLKNRKKDLKAAVPKVIIKKNGNGSHYTSTAVKSHFNPDLTGSKWQPWVTLDRCLLIDRMIAKRKTKATFCLLTEQFNIQQKNHRTCSKESDFRTKRQYSIEGVKETPLKCTITLNPKCNEEKIAKSTDRPATSGTYKPGPRRYLSHSHPRPPHHS